MHKRSVSVAVGLMLMVSIGGVGRQQASAIVLCFNTVATIVDTDGVIKGTSSTDVFFVLPGVTATVNGSGGDDYLCSDSDLATLNGGTGNDSLAGKGWLYGESGSDFIDGNGAVVIDGGSGGDTIIGNASGEIYGGSGNDVITANDSQAVYGGSGSDEIEATNNALVDCGSGTDHLTTNLNDEVVRCEKIFLPD